MRALWRKPRVVRPICAIEHGGLAPNPCEHPAMPRCPAVAVAVVALVWCGTSDRQQPIALGASVRPACPHRLLNEALVSPEVGYLSGNGGSPACPAFILASRDGGRTFTRCASPQDAVEIVFTSAQRLVSHCLP
jgi:hypothetical protein